MKANTLAFITMVLAAASMDSKNQIVPGIVAIAATLILLGQALKERRNP